MVSFLCLWGFVLKGCLGPAQNCMNSCGQEERDPAIKQCVKQLNKMLQCTLLLVKMPKDCSFHNGRYAWSPGYVFFHCYWSHPPNSMIQGWALLKHQWVSHWALQSCVDMEKLWILCLLCILFLVLWGYLWGTSGLEHDCVSVALIIRNICCLI